MKITLDHYKLAREELGKDLPSLSFEEEVILNMLKSGFGDKLFQLITPTPEITGILIMLLANALLTGVKIGQANPEWKEC